MNLHGPVRVVDNAGSGDATVVLSFDAWKDVPVFPTSHTIKILPPKPGPKPEPVAGNLIASLVHPERTAVFSKVGFSPDGARVFGTGYPSGIVQFWNVASKKETLRIDTPPGYRSTSEYALLTPDWKTLYVPAEKRTVKPIERDGKKLYQIDYAGNVRVWDVATGEEKEPLQSAADSAPSYGRLSPDGRSLVCINRVSYESSGGNQKAETVVWDLAARKKRKLCDDFANVVFAPDGKTLALSILDAQSRKSTLKLFQLQTGKELADLDCPEKDRYFSMASFSPDGSVVAVKLGGKKGAPPEVWFLDATTLKERSRFVGKADPDGYGWVNGEFTPDGKRFLVADVGGKLFVWNVADGKVERTLQFGGGKTSPRAIVFSPDGETVAVSWQPKADEEFERSREPDPQDLPQPRVSLVDLAGKAAPQVLIAPHGYLGGLAFSPDGKRLAFGGCGAVHLFDLTK